MPGVGKGKHHHRAAAPREPGDPPRSVGSSPPPDDPAAAAAIIAGAPPPAIGSGLTVTSSDLGGFTPWWGVTVEQALALSAVNRCVSVIAGAVSRLPWRELEGTTILRDSRIVARPAASLTRREWTWRVTATLALESVCYLLMVGGEDDEGIPWSLLPVPPQVIEPVDPDPWGMAPPTAYYIGDERVSAESVLILRRALWPGIPDHLAGVLRLARRELGAALAADAYAARYWGGGGTPTVYIRTEQAINREQAETIGDLWRQRRAMGPDYPAVLGKGAEAHPFGADPTQAAAVDARRELVAEVARYFGVPTRLVNAPVSDSETYANVESEGLDLVRYCLGDYMGPIEDAITGLLPGDERAMRIDPTTLTRGLQGQRYTAWAVATGGKPWMLPAEVREAEHLAPLEPAELEALSAGPAPNAGADGADVGTGAAFAPVAAE